jgi:hypothetical protein
MRLSRQGYVSQSFVEKLHASLGKCGFIPFYFQNQDEVLEIRILLQAGDR